jgi:uncharacterized protein involved in exopolysaccharide biosynthesis
VTPAERMSSLDAGRVDLLALWRVVWAHKLIIIATTLAGGLISLYMALTAVPVFRAEVQVALVTNGNLGAAAGLANQFGGLANLVGLNLAGGGTDTARESQGMLNSRKLVEEFVVRNKLIPVLFPKQKPPTLWFAVRYFRDNLLSIREDKRTGLTAVAVHWTDPEIAARWANEFVGLANELLRARAIAQSKASVEYLNSQLENTNVLEVQRVMYSLIESETKTLMLANAKPEYAFTTIDPAVKPEVKYSPRRTLMVLLGLTAGGVIGLLIAFVHNLWRQQKLA